MSESLNAPGSSRLPGIVRLVIVDDDALFRDALKRVIGGEPDLAVVGVAMGAEEAVQMTHELRPDVLLLNLAMRAGALDVVMAVAGGGTGATRTVVLAGPGDQEATVRALQLGACGVVGKHSRTSALLEGIRKVAQGQCAVESRHLADVVQAVRRFGTRPAAVKGASRYGLTPRELEIVACVTRGESNRSIATRCAISEDTVKHHVSNIFDKLGVYSRLELAMFAVHHKLVTDRVRRAG
jgi:DNA-binding NarL/FixJ family response regulator